MKKGVYMRIKRFTFVFMFFNLLIILFGCSITKDYFCTSKCSLCMKCVDTDCFDKLCTQKCTCRNANYKPLSTNQIPRIDIDTSNQDNSWATKYNRQDKINGLIDYTDALVSVTNCNEKWELINTPCEVKVRGNYTLDYPQKPIRLKFEKKQSMLGLNGGNKFKKIV